MLREIDASEVDKLRDCLVLLADYHNSVSVNFKGTYPSRPVDKTLSMFETALINQSSRIAVIEEESEIIAFSKTDFDGKNGKLDYLFVKENHRGKGHGTALMSRAMSTFREAGVSHIEVKVVDGNPAIHLYEKFGFRINALILVNKI